MEQLLQLLLGLIANLGASPRGQHCLLAARPVVAALVGALAAGASEGEDRINGQQEQGAGRKLQDLMGDQQGQGGEQGRGQGAGQKLQRNVSGQKSLPQGTHRGGWVGAGPSQLQTTALGALCNLLRETDKTDKNGSGPSCAISVATPASPAASIVPNPISAMVSFSQSSAVCSLLQFSCPLGHGALFTSLSYLHPSVPTEGVVHWVA